MKGKYIMCAACGTSNWTDFEYCRNCNSLLERKVEKIAEDGAKRQRKTSLTYRLNKILRRRAS